MPLHDEGETDVGILVEAKVQANPAAVVLVHLIRRRSHRKRHTSCNRAHTVEVKQKSFSFNCSGTVEQLNSNGKTVFARFETVHSALAPEQPFVRSIVSFLARKAYT